MRCAVCGKPCVVDEVTFYEGYPLESWKSLHPGKPWHPLRSWTITVPVYFKAKPSGVGCGVPFCGVACMLRWHESRRAV